MFSPVKKWIRGEGVTYLWKLLIALEAAFVLICLSGILKLYVVFLASLGLFFVLFFLFARGMREEVIIYTLYLNEGKMSSSDMSERFPRLKRTLNRLVRKGKIEIRDGVVHLTVKYYRFSISRAKIGDG